MLRAVNSGGGGGIFLLLGLPIGALLDLALAAFLFGQALSCWLVALGVIMMVCEAAWMLSSSIENLSARQYNSSIVADGSRNKDWKNGVVSPKLLLKFCKTASIL